MKNDPPTTLRRGYGFQQARVAGAPFDRPLSEAEMNADLRQEAASKKIAKLCEGDRAFKQFVEDMLAAGYSVTNIVFTLPMSAPEQQRLRLRLRQMRAAGTKTKYPVETDARRRHRHKDLRQLEERLREVELVHYAVGREVDA
jgi:hypothetical protein